MNVGIERIDTHEKRTMKALLDSGATGMFISKSLAQKRGYRLIKLDRPLQVKNVNGTSNSGGAITYEVKVNMPWLIAHNPEIDREKREVRMTKCLPLCGKSVQIQRKGKKEVREDEKKMVR